MSKQEQLLVEDFNNSQDEYIITPIKEQYSPSDMKEQYEEAKAGLKDIDDVSTFGDDGDIEFMTTIFDMLQMDLIDVEPSDFEDCSTKEETTALLDKAYKEIIKAVKDNEDELIVKDLNATEYIMRTYSDIVLEVRATPSANLPELRDLVESMEELQRLETDVELCSQDYIFIYNDVVDDLLVRTKDMQAIELEIDHVPSQEEMKVKFNADSAKDLFEFVKEW